MVPFFLAAEAPSWLPLVGLALGGVVFVACWQMIDLVWHRCRGVRTTGRVIKLEQQEMHDDDGPVFAPIVEYRMDGRRCRIKSLIAMAPALYREGQEVPVYYFAGHPGSGRVVAGREFFKWILVILGCLIGLTILLNAK